jgi:hypothetical protein
MNNRLLNIDEVINLLDEDFLPLESIVSGLRLKTLIGSREELKKVEERLEVKLPEDFIEFILHYNLGDFNILGVHFGNESNYSEKLLDLKNHLSQIDSLNLSNEFICIAQGDYYTYIIEIKTNNIYAYSSEIPFDERIFVSNSLLQFICLLGTAYFHRKENTRGKFLKIVKEEFKLEIDFWNEIIED